MTSVPTYNINDLVVPGDRTTVLYGQRTLNLGGKLKYAGIVWKAQRTLTKFHRRALEEKECFYGPFKGEFGHFLLHNLPYLTFLYNNGVKIHYCGMTLHEPFLRNESGESMVHRFYPLRDFFPEVKPVSNNTNPPPDVKSAIEKFNAAALASGKPFLDLADHDMYWYVFRNWQLKGKQATFDYTKVYPVKRENAVTIFPRKKGGSYTANNGGTWDYQQVAETLSPYFDHVYITGHPSMSTEIREHGNIRLRLSPDNEEVIKTCAASKLIVTQHSGAVHMGGYTRSDVLVIFNGKPPIKGLGDTLRFRENLTSRPLNFAFSLEEIESFARSYNT
jgi:hypothetical protein